MDIGLSLQERNNKYFYAMAKIEADNLINLSRRVSFNNIKDVFLRMISKSLHKKILPLYGTPEQTTIARKG
ncbi:hypothetical protein [Yersinia similis]|uniref:hypothetical protein n=1 Tax=Yersinia similis TaxID=367190 RepID=UPI00119F8F44|nr:hypothetical protein [Yersinia similis]